MLYWSDDIFQVLFYPSSFIVIKINLTVEDVFFVVFKVQYSVNAKRSKLAFSYNYGKRRDISVFPLNFNRIVGFVRKTH